MTSRTADIVCLAALAVTVLASVLLYPSLPDPMPSHWNVLGEVDGYMPKPWGVIVLPASVLLSWALVKWIQHLSAKKSGSRDVQNALRSLQVATVLFLCAVTGLVLLAASGGGDFVGRLVPMGVGILFVVIGFVIRDVGVNDYLGVRTPWTRADETNWRRSNRLAGWLFVLGGAALVAESFLDYGPNTFGRSIVIILFVGLAPVLYSYVLHRRASHREENAGDGPNAG